MPFVYLIVGSSWRICYNSVKPLARNAFENMGSIDHEHDRRVKTGI